MFTKKMFTKRQNEIIEVSIKLIAEKGIQNLTIKNLAASLRITEGAIYRHFSSKNEILYGILQKFQEFEDSLFYKVEKKKGEISHLDLLRFMFKEHFLYFSKHPEFATIIFSEQSFRNNEKLSKYVLSIMNNKQKFLEKFIEEGQKNKEIRQDCPASHIVMSMLGAFRLITLRWYLTLYTFDMEREGMSLFDSIHKMISI